MDLLSGGIADYFVAFMAGLAVSFTPCVYPLLPVTVSVIAGAHSGGKSWRSFFFSLIYVFGIALTYSVLAVFAALTGRLFGEFQNNPWLFFIVAGLFLIFGLEMLGVFPWPVFSFWNRTVTRPRNAWGIFLMGIASGLIMGPCTAPILGSLLLYIASQKNIFHGVSVMFVFAYGTGFSLLIVGLFSGWMVRIPKAGRWMEAVKKTCGVILLITAALLLMKVGTLMKGR